MNTEAKAMSFGWSNARPCGSHAYLLRPLLDVLKRRAPDPVRTRVIDIGCGNGAATDVVRSLGYNIIGVEPSRDGVAQARKSFPNLHVEAASAYDDLQERFGDFDTVICLEVIEHLYSPALLAQNIRRLLRPGGFAVLSTPYHGYFKNLALSLAGKWDFHHHPLVEHGHIKFWSRPTLERLVEDASLCPAEFYRLGRLPMLAKSMMLVAVKPN